MHHFPDHTQFRQGTLIFAFHDLLLVYGITSRDIILRSENLYVDPRAFINELNAIETDLLG